MQTEAIFENIAERILTEIQKANNSIYIAVAWFTNKSIFEQLIKKAKNGCQIQIIISNDLINENSSIDFNKLEKHNGKVYKIGNGDTELMHNKFCIIDFNTVITGSYNWSYKAENNFENIVINSNDTSLAEQFVTEFNQIKKKYYPNETIQNEFPIEIIIKRLEIIKNIILLEDIDDISIAVEKLKRYQFNEDVKTIISSISNKEFAKAITTIQEFINSYQQITIWNDPEIAGIRLEIKILESQINAFDNEKIELEKVISDFQHRHTIELGEVILEVLRLRKIKYKNHKKEAEAEEDFNNYSKQYETEKDKKQFELNEEEKLELKKKFRKATTMCHPDKVSEEQKAEAEEIFIELKKAYDEHDLEKLKGIENEIISLKETEIFTTINNISNWDNYFTETKTQLEQELQNLKVELNN